ncbi:MAG: polyamine aminopropyltransferase [Dehalococcoidia bacterium]|nr:polyamine aminopropyltransferase [Dehalococcoidia bacterium]
MDDDPSVWFSDVINPNFVQQYRVRGTLYTGQTRYQTMQVIDSCDFGLCLVLDGKLQSSQRDEFIYHEALVHPALISHPDPATVFIAGGGEGATLREVLAHSSVKKAVMVDIDREAVDVCRRFLPSMHQGSFDDTRLELLHLDARKYLSETSQEFDAIVMDITDPVEGGPSYMLYTREFYRIAAKRLTPGGVIVVQSGPCNLHDMAVFTAIHNTLREVFPDVFPYAAVVPSFGGAWGFMLAGTNLDPLTMSAGEINKRLQARVTRGLRFYDGLTHHGMFRLPRYLRDALRAPGPVITDHSPIFLS